MSPRVKALLPDDQINQRSAAKIEGSDEYAWLLKQIAELDIIDMEGPIFEEFIITLDAEALGVLVKLVVESFASNTLDTTRRKQYQQ
jgi:hypothetical protein